MDRRPLLRFALQSAASVAWRKMSWSHPPRPIEVIPSFNPKANKRDQVRAVLWDFWHDPGIRSAFGGKHYFILGGGGASVESIDPASLVALYDSPNSAVKEWNKGEGAQSQMTADELRAQPWFKALGPAIDAAIAKRKKLGALPPNEYGGDPIVIYYYDDNVIKKVTYPRKSLTTAPGGALDPANRTWWKGNGIGVYVQDPNTKAWGEEGFDWDKDVAGNMLPIFEAIAAVISAVLIATGVGAAAGAALIAFSQGVAAWAGMLDEGIHGNDTSKGLQAFLGAVSQFLGAGISQIPSGLAQETLKQTQGVLKSLTPLVTKSQAAGASFSETANDIIKQAKTIPVVTRESVQQLVTLGGGPAMLAGYDASLIADSLTLQGIASIIPSSDSSTLFQMGAYLGLLQKEQLKAGGTAHARQAAGAAATPASKYALHSFVRTLPAHTTTPSVSASVALTNYVHDVLIPRYHLK